jgi:hypothetical protein
MHDHDDADLAPHKADSFTPSSVQRTPTARRSCGAWTPGSAITSRPTTAHFSASSPHVRIVAPSDRRRPHGWSHASGSRPMRRA